MSPNFRHVLELELSIVPVKCSRSVRFHQDLKEEQKIFLLKKTTITSIWGMRRKGREPEQQTTKFGGEQLDIWCCEKNPWRWEKLGSSKNDLCPLGGIFFVWLNVMAAKTSFWLNTLAWGPSASTIYSASEFRYLDWAWVWMTELW